MTRASLATLGAEVSALRPARAMGRITRLGRGLVEVSGLAEAAGLSDAVRIETAHGPLEGEITELHAGGATVLPEGMGDGLCIGDPVLHLGPASVAPHEGWIGRIVDASGRPLDGRPLAPGNTSRALRSRPPPAAQRRRLGPRLGTGLAVFDTMLPLVRGQRLGVFAGSGVGKSRLLGALAQGVTADVAVIALIGERGREVREFVEEVLGPEGLARSIVVVATSDEPPLRRRRALWTAMVAAEVLRDLDRHVLFLADSITRFAEAHREVAIAAGESAALRGFPPSTAQTIMQLAERAGPGLEGSEGDITAVFSVLVAGADMEEPIADTLRGTLDGHIVLDRAIAERGRFPSVNVLKSVSRALPSCASDEENALITLARRRLGAWDNAELMVQSGLYTAGADAEIDAAVATFPALDGFFAMTARDGPAAAFAQLSQVLGTAVPRRSRTAPAA